MLEAWTGDGERQDCFGKESGKATMTIMIISYIACFAQLLALTSSSRLLRGFVDRLCPIVQDNILVPAAAGSRDLNLDKSYREQENTRKEIVYTTTSQG